MNEEHDADATPGPGQDAQIRALLAELGSGPDGEEMPPEVAARLEDTLALLVAERGREDMAAESTGVPAGSTDNVIPMRRRWVPRLAGAAAAVIVLGAGGVAVAHLDLLGGSGSSMSHNTAADGAGDSKAETAPESSAPSAGDDAREGLAGGAPASLPRLSAATFAADVEQLLERRGSLGAPQDASSSGTVTEQRKTDAGVHDSCPGPRTTDGAVPSPVRYGGDLAVLVVHPERDGHRLVEAWDCAGNRRLDQARLTP